MCNAVGSVGSDAALVHGLLHFFGYCLQLYGMQAGCLRLVDQYHSVNWKCRIPSAALPSAAGRGEHISRLPQTGCNNQYCNYWRVQHGIGTLYDDCSRMSAALCMMTARECQQETSFSQVKVRRSAFKHCHCCISNYHELCTKILRNTDGSS